MQGGWRVLDRYIFREAVGPTALGVLVYTFILLINALFSATKFLVVYGAPAKQVGLFLLYNLPNILVITVPSALLFGCLVAVGRFAADSELTALRACGISLYSLYRPILALSLILTLVATFLMTFVLPRGNFAVVRILFDITTKSATQQVTPRVFYEEFEGKILYVFENPPDEKRWKGVFLAEDLPGSDNRVITAEWGELRLDEESDRLLLYLENAITHEIDFRDPNKYQIARSATQQVVLETRFMSHRRATASVTKGLRSKTLPELALTLEDPNITPELSNLTKAEMHKRFSIPAACVVFGLLALPLGYSTRRSGGRSSGFAVSVGIIVVYWVFLENGEKAAQAGWMPPWLSMWLPNLVFLAVGVYLLSRRNQDKRLLGAVLDRWLRTRRWRLPFTKETTSQAEAGGAAGSPAAPGRRTRGAVGVGTNVVLRLPRMKVRFPNLLDRYVIRVFATTFVFVQLALVSVFLVADLTSRMDEFGGNDVALGIVLKYYQYASLDYFYQVTPISVLLTTLITFGLLSRTNEVIAAKALGVSLYRLAVPAAFAALLVSGLCVVLESSVLPESNQKVARLKDIIKGREGARTYRRADRQWLFGQGRYIYNYLRYDRDSKALDRLQVFEFEDQNRSVSRRLMTKRATHLGDSWVFEEGWLRTFDGASVTSFEPFDSPVIVDYPQTPDYFESEIRLPESMTYPELSAYIAEIEDRGQRVPDLRVALHRKISFPLISFVMALVALPFSFQLGRKGALYGVGIGIALGMIFFGVFAFFTTLGETGSLPPLLAVWTPNVAFALYSVYRFLGLET